jgi:uncharacterized protein
MRLQGYEIKSIKESVRSLDNNAKVYLFGSRTYDDKRGGDIDLLIISNILKHSDQRKIRYSLYDKIGEQKIDVIIAQDASDPFIKIALNEGILL